MVGVFDGDKEGETVGLEFVGETVGLDVVGESEGETVGLELVGDFVGEDVGAVVSHSNKFIWQ